jgi:hypothetical protein
VIVRRSTCASFTGTQKQECLLVQGFSYSPQTRQQPSQSDSSSALHIIIEAAAALLPLLQHPVAVQNNAHHSCFKQLLNCLTIISKNHRTAQRTDWPTFWQEA